MGESTAPSITESLGSKVDKIEKNQISSHVNVWDYLVSDDDENLLESPGAERTPINVLDYLTIPERDTSIDGVNPFLYQKSNDAWTIKVTEK